MQSADSSVCLKQEDVKNILIVEDEPSVAMHIESRLVSMAYNVVAKAVSAEEAVYNARKYQPDLILMDIKLDGKLDGIDAAEIINSNMNVPIIYLTAWMNDELITRAKATVPFGYIMKPFHDSELRAMIEMALHKKNVEREHRDIQNVLKGILDNLDVALISINMYGSILFCNPFAEKLFDIPLDEMTGQPVSFLMSGDSSKPYIRKIENILSNQKPLDSIITEHMCFHTDTRKIVSEVAFIPCGRGEDSFITLVINDFKTNSAGFLPICAHCKKVRIDNSWISVEHYFYTHLHLGLTHSICPECINTFFPGIQDTPPEDTRN